MQPHRFLLSALLLILFCSVSIVRSAVFQDDITLFSDVIRKSPDKARPHNNLGHAYKQADKPDLAVLQFERAVALAPDYPDALNNLATLYNFYNRSDEALDLISRALARYPNHYPSRFNLAMLFYEKQLYTEATKEFEAVIQLAPMTREAAFSGKMLALIRQTTSQ